jgi:hypothetical protein
LGHTRQLEAGISWISPDISRSMHLYAFVCICSIHFESALCTISKDSRDVSIFQQTERRIAKSKVSRTSLLTLTCESCSQRPKLAHHRAGHCAHPWTWHSSLGKRAAMQGQFRSVSLCRHGCQETGSCSHAGNPEAYIFPFIQRPEHGEQNQNMVTGCYTYTYNANPLVIFWTLWNPPMCHVSHVAIPQTARSRSACQVGQYHNPRRLLFWFGLLLSTTNAVLAQKPTIRVKKRWRAHTCTYMYMFMNPEDGNLRRPPKR